MKHYSTILKEEREKAGPSRRSVAKQAGITEGHLRFIEKGERDTKPATLRKLAQAIGIDERPLMESWLQENMPAMDYSDLAERLPKGIDVEQLEEIYSIQQAKKIYQKIQSLTVNEVKKLPVKDIIQMRTALQNCLGFIGELEVN